MTAPARVLGLALALVSSTLLAACATLKVNSFSERDADIGQYRTFALEPPAAFETGDPRLDNNVFFQEQLQAALAKGMVARGFTAAERAQADVVVHCHASIRQEVEVNAADIQRGYAVGATGHQANPHVFDEGTLTIDVVDARTSRLVWRGWLERSLDGAIDDQAWLERQIQDTVARILDTLPRKH